MRVSTQSINSRQIPSSHYVQQGDYWPVDRHRGGVVQRFGIMQVQGYPELMAKRWLTTFYVIDSAMDGEIVREFTATGRPGMHDVQSQRERACDLVDVLNRRERETA